MKWSKYWDHLWLHYLEQVDAPMEQKIELIDTLWSIVNGFADFGWNISFSPESCGEDLDLYAALSAAVVRSDQTENANKGDAA